MSGPLLLSGSPGRTRRTARRNTSSRVAAESVCVFLQNRGGHLSGVRVTEWCHVGTRCVRVCAREKTREYFGVYACTCVRKRERLSVLERNVSPVTLHSRGTACMTWFLTLNSSVPSLNMRRLCQCLTREQQQEHPPAWPHTQVKHRAGPHVE